MFFTTFGLSFKGIAAVNTWTLQHFNASKYFLNNTFTKTLQLLRNVAVGGGSLELYCLSACPFIYIHICIYNGVYTITPTHSNISAPQQWPTSGVPLHFLTTMTLIATLCGRVCVLILLVSVLCCVLCPAHWRACVFALRRNHVINNKTRIS